MCILCSGMWCNKDFHGRLLTEEELLRITRAAAKEGIAHVKVTGGEPLLRPNLAGLVQKIREIPGIETVTLTTNGILLPDQIDALAAAGISGINISLDTLNKERYRSLTRGGELERALAGLAAAKRQKGVTVKVNAVLYETHWEEDALTLAALAKKDPVHVRFIEHMPLGTEAEERPVREDAILALLQKEYGKCESYKGKIGEGPGHYVTFPGMTGKIGFISAISHKSVPAVTDSSDSRWRSSDVSAKQRRNSAARTVKRRGDG